MQVMHDSMTRLLECAKRRTQGVPAHLRVLDAADLGRRMDQSPQTITNWKTRGVSERGAIAAERIFGCPAAWVLTGAGAPPNWTHEQHAPEGGATRVVAHQASQPGQYATISRPTRVPVLHQGRPTSAGELQMITHQPAGTVEAAGVSTEAFAIRIEGDELFPALRHGMFVICDPAAPCVPGEWVLLELANGTMHVRELLFGQAEDITTVGVLGGQRRTTPRAEVRRVTAIVGTAFASRWAALQS